MCVCVWKRVREEQDEDDHGEHEDDEEEAEGNQSCERGVYVGLRGVGVGRGAGCEHDLNTLCSHMKLLKNKC